MVFFVAPFFLSFERLFELSFNRQSIRYANSLFKTDIQNNAFGHLENHVIYILSEEVEKEPVSHRRLLHDHLNALGLHPSVPTNISHTQAGVHT